MRPEDAAVPGCATCTRGAVKVRTARYELAEAARFRAAAKSDRTIRQATTRLAGARDLLDRNLGYLTDHLNGEHQ